MSNQEQSTPLVEQVKKELADSGLSQQKAAQEIGISQASFSQWVGGKYANPAAIEAKVARWLESRQQRADIEAQLPVAPGYLRLPSALRIEAGLVYAQMASDIAVIYGGAGCGKTMAARIYREQHNNVWIATMTPSTCTLGPCLERVALSTGLRPATMRASRIEADLVDRLEGTHGLIIVDEAQHLHARSIEAIRSLHDATGVGVALMGNESVYARITGGSRAAEFAQLFSRIGKRVRLTRPSKADVKTLLTAWGVGDDAEIMTASIEIAARPGALRGLTKTLRLASLFAAGEPLSITHLRAAWDDLGEDR
jgi:DNA transposition AAA+ family ATPase